MVAHDLRTPLAAISGHAQLAARRLRRAEPAPPVAAAPSDLARVQVGAKRMARWVEALSDVARGSLGGPAPLDVQEVDLVALTEQVLAEHRQPGSRHRFRLETTAAPLAGRWDAGRLERVLHNLVGNAIKYSPDGGEIDVALGREGQPEDAAGGYAVVRIGDHGLGIPAADLPHIFEPFRRGNNVAGFIEGSGIGLAGAQQIVALHGGTIEAESTEGQGSTFTVRLALAAAAGRGRARGGRGRPATRTRGRLDAGAGRAGPGRAHGAETQTLRPPGKGVGKR